MPCCRAANSAVPDDSKRMNPGHENVTSMPLAAHHEATPCIVSMFVAVPVTNLEFPGGSVA
jgi:hypothetical protein